MNNFRREKTLFKQINSYSEEVVYIIQMLVVWIGVPWVIWNFKPGVIMVSFYLIVMVGSVWFIGRMVKRIRKFQPFLEAKEQVTDGDLQLLLQRPSIAGLWLQNTQITNDGLATAAKMPSLVTLTLDSTRIDDRGLEHLKALSSLEELSLEETQVTDEGLKHLQNLPSLSNLWLDNTQVTDKGVELLLQFPHLKALSLTNVSERAIRSICTHPTLETFVIGGTCATRPLVEELTHRHPQLKIVFIEDTN